MKRNADVSSVRWFECDPCYVFHPMNAYEDGDKIVGDVMQYDAAPLFPDPDGRPGDPAKAVARLTRWTFDLAANTDGFRREQIDDLAGEFPRLDERFAGLDYRQRLLRRRAATAKVCRSLRHAGAFRPEDWQAHGISIAARAMSCRSRSSSRAAPTRPKATVICSRRSIAAPRTVAILRCSTPPRWSAARSLSRELSHRVPFGFHGNWRPAA